MTLKSDEESRFQVGYLSGLATTDRAIGDGDRVILRKCAEKLEHQQAQLNTISKLAIEWINGTGKGSHGTVLNAIYQHAIDRAETSFHGVTQSPIRSECPHDNRKCTHECDDGECWRELEGS